MKILLTGATGFVGKQLLPKLLSQLHQVTCLVRKKSSADKLAGQSVEVVIGDASDGSTLSKALTDCDAAYYLIHSMTGDGDFREQDRAIAESFAKVAAKQDLKRIIYVSGLANEFDPELSEHLASRLEVGKILRNGKTPCIELRAAMVIGDGSISFRMVKHLCHRLPIMLCPKWLSTQTQPLAASDLIDYLVQSLTSELAVSQAIEIGGRDRTTYLEILKIYCDQQNLKRVMIPVPLLTPKLSGYWLTLVTPETAEVGKQMIDGLRNPTVVRSDKASKMFNIRPMSIADAITAAIREDEANK